MTAAAVVHPIERAWITTGGTGAQNYDEFADETEITRIIAANPRSALAVEMPHRAPGHGLHGLHGLHGTSFADALPAAVERLATAEQDGAYLPAHRVVVLYRISGPVVTHGLFGMVDTDQISTSADQPGLVIRNEDVFEEKVRERVALARATGHLLSPVLLLQSSGGAGAAPSSSGRLSEELARACRAAGPPAATDVDQAGRVHEIWPVPPGPLADRLCALAGDGELVVADGNHRTLAAQTGGLTRFLAVVTTPDAVTIAPYHRLITESPYPAGQLPERIAAAGARADRVPDLPDSPPPRGVAYLYTAGGCHAVSLPADPAAPAVDNLDHAVVERLLLRDVLGLDPGDKRVGYVGGDYPVSWLRSEVDAGRADAAIVIAPVSVSDFVAVNLARQKLPRKSTWFTPKARAGLVLAELD
ncbi:MAG: DUF1015 family protein [Micromonosporaceae bacterium]|nr:DUF1015 family protein [Micromonosporaceae bacterium]